MKIKNVAIISLLSSLSIVLAQISHYLPVPGVHMLKLDFSDIPVFISTLVFGQACGFLTLFISSFVRAIFFSSAGVPGFSMRMIVSSSVIFLLSNLYKRNIKIWKIFAISIMVSTISKVIVNYFFWTKFFCMSKDWVLSIMVPVVIPHHIIRLIVELLTAFIIFKRLKVLNIKEKYDS